jgi:hypothetical protein
MEEDSKLKETFEKLLEYLDEHKYPERHQFVKAFTSHLGHIATSRGEQGHYQLPSR